MASSLMPSITAVITPAFFRVAGVSDNSELRRSLGSGWRPMTPSRSMRASVAAIVGCSMPASSVRTFWDKAPPGMRAVSTGKYPDVKPSGASRFIGQPAEESRRAVQHLTDRSRHHSSYSLLYIFIVCYL